ncbi:MAG: rhodanese-like domain-containing protein, partial [Gammaproteobacteria bacterium]|nr:rhodanese-like domain-containing protein [Gammaproteobacteria bacterium]
MREFNAQELKAHLETCDQQPLLLDVRQPWEFEVCKIENSVLLPMSQITAEYN